MVHKNQSMKFFPERVGRYVFSELVSCSGKKNTPYLYAVYTDEQNEKKAFAKLLVGNRSSAYFRKLSNEALVYETLWKFLVSNPDFSSKFPNIFIPKLLHSVVSKEKVFILLEFISGKNLAEFSSKKKVEVCVSVLEYFFVLGSLLESSGSEYKRSFSRRGFWYWFFSVPCIALFSMMRYPKKFFLIFRCFLLCMTHSWSVSNPFRFRFAHHDMSEWNIFLDGEKICIIDFELAAITYPAFDEASIALKLWDNQEEYDHFLSSLRTSYQFRDKSFRKSFFSVSIYLAIYNLLLKNGRSREKMFEFLEHTLSSGDRNYEGMTPSFSLRIFVVSRWRVFKNFVYSRLCFSNKKVEIFSYDPAVQNFSLSLQEEIRSIAPELPVHCLGSSSFGIAGMKDIDVFVEVPALEIPRFFSLFSDRFGAPVRKRKTFVEWKLNRSGWTVEMLLIDPKTEKFREQMFVCEVLRNDPNLLREYELLKYSFHGKSICEYRRQKTSFFSRIMIERDGYFKKTQ